MSDKYSKENLKQIVEKSNSIRQVCLELGISGKGGNYKTVRKYIELHELNTNHFLSKEDQLKEIQTRNKIPLEEILVKNSSYTNNFHLKKRLVDEEVLEYKCEKCNNIGEWQGEELTLQLDHKNGISNDNRVKNLRFLCPNCHSQTETWGFKSNK